MTKKGKRRPGSRPAKPKTKPNARQRREKGEVAEPADAERRKPTRTERLEAARRERRRRTLKTKVITAAVISALVLSVAGYFAFQWWGERQAIAELTAGSCTFDRLSDPGRVNEHIANPTFAVEPPAGGVHTPEVAGPGVYSGESTPADGQLVHGLEHGLIAVWHQPDLPEADTGRLRDLANEFDDVVMLVSRPGLDVPVAATAWHKRLLCTELEFDQVRRFVIEFRNQGPERVPRG